MSRSMSPLAAAAALSIAVTSVGEASAEPLGQPRPLQTAAGVMSFAAAGDAAGNALIVVRPGFVPNLTLIERSAGGDWSAPAALPGAGAPVASAEVAAAGDGAAAVVWRRAEGRYGGIEALVRDPGAAFAGPLAVAGADAGGVRHPVVGVDARGGVVVAFQAGTGGAAHASGRIAVALRRPGGSAFTPPVPVTRASAGPPSLAVSPDGHAVVAWQRADRIEAVSIDGRHIGRPRVLGRGPGGSVSLAVGRGGDAVVAWSAFVQSGKSAGRPYITAALRRRPGRFGRAVVIARNGFLHDVAMRDDGRAMVLQSGSPEGLRAALAEPGAHRFANAREIWPGSAGLEVALAATPTGFAALWQVPPADPESGWQLALARGDGPMLAAGRVSEPFVQGYGLGGGAVFGDRRGVVTAVWVQPPGIPPPSPPAPGEPPMPQEPRLWTLEVAEGNALAPA
jgi:hypothetical protein